MPLLTIQTSPTLIVPVNQRRATLMLKNVGNHPIYIRRLKPGENGTVTTTDYDVMLDKGEFTTISSISRFIGIANPQASELVVLQTEYI